jgi:phenylacetate-CoA ligase
MHRKQESAVRSKTHMSGSGWDAGEPTWINGLYVNVVLPYLTSRRSRAEGLGSRLRQYRKRESLTISQNRETQWADLQRLLSHAYESSPFYRRRFEEAGLRPRDIQTPADFQKLPLLTREDLRTQLNDILSCRFSKSDLIASATGGTTDTPLPLFLNSESAHKKAAAQWRFNSWAGFFPGDKVLYLWGARVDYAENPGWRWKLYDRYVMRRMWAPTSLFNRDVFERYRLMLNDFRPRIIFCYPSPLALFCEYLRECGKEYHRPLSAICTAEATLPQHKQVIEEVLGCPVFNHYGTRDFGMVAAECERREGLHINPAVAYVEFVPVPGAEVEGLHEILVTDLTNYGMPLIRYKINDCTVAGPETCSCGRGYPLMQAIVGRTMDVFYMPNGDVVPGISLQNRIIKVCPGIRKMQVIQETQDEFRIRYVPAASFTEADMKMLQGNLQKFFPFEIRWTFERVAEIEREKSGKTRFCISKVAGPDGPRVSRPEAPEAEVRR